MHLGMQCIKPDSLTVRSYIREALQAASQDQHQPYFSPINLPHPSCSSSVTVGVAVTVVSGVLPRGACHRRCKQTKTTYSLRLSVSSTLKVNQPSIAPLHADKVSMNTFYMMRPAESCNFV